jgi:hypothetical protein
MKKRAANGGRVEPECRNVERQESEDKNELKVQELNSSPSDEASIMRVPALASFCTSESLEEFG